MSNFTKEASSSRSPISTTGVVPPGAPRNPYSRSASNKCYQCGQPGHYSNQCLKRGVMNLIEQGENTDIGVKRIKDEIEDLYEEEEITSSDKGELLSHMMGADTKITITCHFQFSIGRNYIDEITCDVVKMDACHMILGRPWQYDMDATYRGQDNVYVFMSGGQKVVLSPLNEDFSVTKLKA
ncbi:hypothetical protein SADUNF_Sadunf07G0061900 [Salix dunnii]|uniref:CCHC-type domain-containing protein n=1 Tax=Salix dunnii TaxID=1413687 RepID=A0A835MZ13_9ROSI|nr:hypothetical protein SADUNF_Sadunf07G0061900 [Salix dunnii]